MTSKQPDLQIGENDIKIGTKEEAAWIDIKDRIEKEIEQDKRSLIINKSILELAEKMIAKEKHLNT